MRYASIILAAIALSFFAAGIGLATIDVNVHGYSSGIYDYTAGMSMSGNAWGSGSFEFAPEGMSADMAVSGMDKFCAEIDQTLIFNKDPGMPSDPLFSMSMDARGTHKGDYATLGATCDYSVTTGALMTGYASGDTKLLELDSYADNFQGWVFSADGVAKDDWATFRATSGYSMATQQIGAKFESWY